MKTLVFFVVGVGVLVAGDVRGRPYTFANVAGLPGTAGNAEGAGTEARFSFPFHLGVDLQGNAYVADLNNHVIRKVTPTGQSTVYAGSPGQGAAVDANGTNARFKFPGGVAVAEDGTVYVADTGNNTIRKIAPNRDVTTLAGLAGASGSANGTGSAARFFNPNGVGVGPDGSVLVADTSNHTIRMVSAAGVVTTLAGQAGVAGGNDGGGVEGGTAHFNLPTAIVYSAAARQVYIADSGNHTVRDLGMVGLDTHVMAGATGQAGEVDGAWNVARFTQPVGLALDHDENLYITDYTGHTVRRIRFNGTAVETLAGLGGVAGTADGTGTGARFNQPVGIGVTFDGIIVISDSVNNRITRGLKSPQPGEYYWGGLAGRWDKLGAVDGTRGGALFKVLHGVAVDPAGNVYVADTTNHTVRKITPAGVTTTVAGIAGNSGSEDSLGVDNKSRLLSPRDVAVDAAGNLYIADTGNYTIRRLSAAGVMSTLAGSVGQSGYANGSGSAARFATVEGLASRRIRASTSRTPGIT